MKRILFHGTASNITAFNENSLSNGLDPNSTLGVHTTDCPAYASEYADRAFTFNKGINAPCVLVLSYYSNGQNIMHDYDEFYGSYDDDTHNKEHFSELRSELIDSDIDLVEFDNDDETITTLLIPEKIKIIDSLSLKEALDLSTYLKKENIKWNMPNEILKAIAFIKNN